MGKDMDRRIVCLLGLLLWINGCASDVSDDPGGDHNASLCGNGIIEDEEKCDDHNQISGDGCSADCTVETGYRCPKEGELCESIGGSDTPKSECGNGIVEKGEACDDHNKIPKDGCSAECQVEDGFLCETQGELCRRIPVCGNGKREDGEACDDHNTASGDGCSVDCQVEDGFTCPIFGEPCAEKCGDEHLDLGEACDDGIYNVEYSLYRGNPIECGLNCQFAHYCGDGKHDQIDIDYGEECDSGEPTPDEYEGCSRNCKRVNYCGDDIISHNETCDDGNTANGDGCSASCQLEDHFLCVVDGTHSVCRPILCGNGKLDINETCDDGNRASGDGCSTSCLRERGWRCQAVEGKGSVCTSTVGNKTIDLDADEECDDGNAEDGDGCSATGAIEPGWICPTAGEKCHAKACGDGILAYGEECDDGNIEDGDGCSWRCRIEKGYTCSTAGSLCQKGRCGDGIVQKGETCDNDFVESGAPTSGDGCSATCTIEPYFECKLEGGECRRVECGDGSITPDDGFVSYETCDLGSIDGVSKNDGTAGCSATCTIVEGWHCDAESKTCAQGKCGDKILDAGEECDDGNHTPADGCSPDCKRESGIDCFDGVCRPICGDGVTMWMLDDAIAEECDDGNLSSGDGCSADCKREVGYVCTDFSVAKLPSYISLPVIYRDFRSSSRDTVASAGTTDGFITPALIEAYPEAGWTSANLNQPLRDFDHQSGCFATGYTLPDLDEDGKPVLKNINGNGNCFQNRKIYSMWYRNTPGINKEVKHKLFLWLQDEDTRTYYFSSYEPTKNGTPNVCADGTPFFSGYTPDKNKEDYFLPLASAGYGYTNGLAPRNYSFTSEVSTYFQYKGGETLTFSGDDDLWVFLNGHLFVDLGGLHGVQTGVGHLKADTCTFTEEDGTEKTVTCDKDYGVYAGGIYEIKLFHAERNATGSNFSLTLMNFVNSGTAVCDTVCGDGIVRGNEECDYVGITTDVALQNEKGCSSTCRLMPVCGNEKIETGEECDSPEAWCDEDCLLTARTCGNGTVDDHEECDDGKDKNGTEESNCLSTCQISGCGDGIVDPTQGEECDDGNDSNEDMCTTACNRPYCGDGITSEFLGEVCDDGSENNDGSYGHCGLGCTYRAPYCGDGIVLEGVEVCDDGINDGSYGGCLAGCLERAPYCGDSIVQTDNDEACDPADPNDDIPCSSRCTRLIY